MKNVPVFEFDPVIYPRKIWISITTNNSFEGFETLPEMDEDTIAGVDNVRNDRDDCGGIFMRFKDNESLNIGVIAHESTHAATMIFDYIGAEVDNNNDEPFAYLVGWIAKCCDEVKNKKID